MIWRTDRPTEPAIVAKLTDDFCCGHGRYAILYLGNVKTLGVTTKCYLEDGEEIPESAIEKWALLDDNQNTDPVDEIKAYWESISKPDRQLGTAAKIDIKQFVSIISHFAQWQKEKMVKDAITGEAEVDCEQHDAWIYLQGNKPNLQHGEKVEVIIMRDND